MSTPATNEPTHQPPAAKDSPTGATSEVKPGYTTLQVAALFLLGCVTCLLLMCLVSGRWAKTDKVRGTWSELSIWGQCQCQDIVDATACGERDRKVQAAKAFSVIAAGFEFFAVLVLLKFPTTEDGKFLIAAFSFLAAASLIITIAVWGNLYNDKICLSKLKNSVHLDWAYGIRIGEFVFALVLTVVAAIGKRGPGVVFFGILILYLTVFTTTSRGWLSDKTHDNAVSINGVNVVRGDPITTEVGLWDYCRCERVGTTNCKKIRELSRAAEAFEIIASATAIVLTALVAGGSATPAAAKAGLAWALFIFVILPWIFFAAIYNEKYCGGKVKDIPTIGLGWAFGIQVALSGLMIVAAALISVAK